MFGWIKKKGNDTATFGKKVVGTEEIKKSFEQAADMAKVVLSPKQQIENAKTESFVDAKKRLNVTDKDLMRNYKNYAYCFYISLIFSLLCFFFLIYNLFINQAIMSSLATLAIFCLCGVNCFKFSFRAFQIKHQKLCSVNEWWQRSQEWFPNIP
jgi:intracellular multiplication protein IcmV